MLILYAFQEHWWKLVNKLVCKFPLNVSLNAIKDNSYVLILFSNPNVFVLNIVFHIE
jgi:hypothetical protein